MKTWKKGLIYLTIPLAFLISSKLTYDKTADYERRYYSLTKENPSVEKIIKIETTFKDKELREKLRIEPEKYNKAIEEYKSLISKPNIFDRVDEANHLNRIMGGYLTATTFSLLGILFSATVGTIGYLETRATRKQKKAK